MLVQLSVHVERYITLANIQEMTSKLASDDDLCRCVSLAGPPRSTVNGRRSPTSLELEACCRVSTRRRFFEEKSRDRPTTPPRRRSRSAAPRLARVDDDRRHPPSVLAYDPPTSRTTQPQTAHAVTSTAVKSQLMSTYISASQQVLSTNNQTDELKV